MLKPLFSTDITAVNCKSESVGVNMFMEAKSTRSFVAKCTEISELSAYLSIVLKLGRLEHELLEQLEYLAQP